jgi:hypothetical protein
MTPVQSIEASSGMAKTHVAYWNDSIASNVLSAQSAKESGDFSEELHAMDYLVYAYLQLGQDDKARTVIDEMRTVTGFSESFIAGLTPKQPLPRATPWSAATGKRRKG